jgi:hypothetical protein
MTDAATTTAAGDAGADGAQAQAQQQTTTGGVPTPADLAAQQQAQAQQQAAAQQATQQQQASQQQDTNPNAPDMTGWPQAAIDAYNDRDRQARQYQREAGDRRIQAKSATDTAMRDAALAFAKAAGLEIPGTEAPTLETVTQQLGGVTTERDEARMTAALTSTAWEQGVDRAKLGYLQYQLSQDAAYKALDPTAADFSDKLSAIVASKLAADATLKAAGSAGASGVESLGGASGNSAITQERFNAMSVAERTDLYTSDRATYDRLAAGQYQRG